MCNVEPSPCNLNEPNWLRVQVYAQQAHVNPFFPGIGNTNLVQNQPAIFVFTKRHGGGYQRYQNYLYYICASEGVLNCCGEAIAAGYSPLDKRIILLYYDASRKALAYRYIVINVHGLTRTCTTTDCGECDTYEHILIYPPGNEPAKPVEEPATPVEEPATPVQEPEEEPVIPVTPVSPVPPVSHDNFFSRYKWWFVGGVVLIIIIAIILLIYRRRRARKVLADD